MRTQEDPEPDTPRDQTSRRSWPETVISMMFVRAIIQESPPVFAQKKDEGTAVKDITRKNVDFNWRTPPGTIEILL